MMVEQNLIEGLQELQDKMEQKLSAAISKTNLGRQLDFGTLRKEFQDELTVQGLVGPDEGKYKFKKFKDYILGLNEDVLEGFQNNKK